MTGVESLQHPGHAPGHALYGEQQPHHPPFFVPAMAALGAQSGMGSPGPDEGSRWAAIHSHSFAWIKLLTVFF